MKTKKVSSRYPGLSNLANKDIITIIVSVTTAGSKDDRCGTSLQTTSFSYETCFFIDTLRGIMILGLVFPLSLF